MDYVLSSIPSVIIFKTVLLLPLLKKKIQLIVSRICYLFRSVLTPLYVLFNLVLQQSHEVSTIITPI
jgi:hypothetical protein